MTRQVEHPLFSSRTGRTNRLQTRTPHKIANTTTNYSTLKFHDICITNPSESARKMRNKHLGRFFFAYECARVKGLILWALHGIKAARVQQTARDASTKAVVLPSNSYRFARQRLSNRGAKRPILHHESRFIARKGHEKSGKEPISCRLFF